MAVNKNFVVKNGLEVNSDLIIADSSNKRVGIGSTIPGYTLEVIGGIGATDIYISGLSTVVGFATFQDSIGVQNDITIAGISTVVGVATFRDNVFIDGNLSVAGDITYDEVNGRNLRITGLSTFVGFSTFHNDLYVAGVVTATSFHGAFYGDGSNITGVAPGLSAAVGVSEEGTFIGAGNTIINFVSTNGAAWDVTSVNGIATATVTPGVSLGLAIALGG